MKNKEKKIFDEVADQVFKESEVLKKEKEKKTIKETNIEALSELSGLPKERILEIEKSVRNKYKKQKKTTGNRILRIVVILISVLFCIWIGKGIISSFAKAYKRNEELKYEELLYTARQNDLEKTEALLSQGVPMEHNSFPYDSPLLEAARSNDAAFIRFLINKGADVLKRNKEGFTALDVSEEGRYLKVQFILAEAIALKAPPEHPVRTLWQMNIHFSHKSFKKYIGKNDQKVIGLFCEADEGEYTHDMDSLYLSLAVKRGHPDILKYLLENGKNIIEHDAGMALIEAAGSANFTSIDILLDYGVDINFHNDSGSGSDYTPLLAALDRMNKASEYLLEKGADPNMAGGGRLYFIPLFYICQRANTMYFPDNRRYEIAKALIKAGADVNMIGEYDRLPIEEAWEDGYYDVADLLKKNGSGIPFTENSFRHLIFERDIENIKDFLNRGIDPDTNGFDHYNTDLTALMYAAREGDIQIASILLEAGADPDIKTSSNHDALYYAETYGRYKMAAFLRNYKKNN